MFIKRSWMTLLLPKGLSTWWSLFIRTFLSVQPWSPQNLDHAGQFSSFQPGSYAIARKLFRGVWDTPEKYPGNAMNNFPQFLPYAELLPETFPCFLPKGGKYSGECWKFPCNAEKSRSNTPRTRISVKLSPYFLPKGRKITSEIAGSLYPDKFIFSPIGFPWFLLNAEKSRSNTQRTNFHGNRVKNPGSSTDGIGPGQADRNSWLM